MVNLIEEKSNRNDWVIEGDTLFPCNGKVSVTDIIKPGVYRVVPAPNPMDNRIGIRPVSEKFDLGVKKIYSTGGEEIQEVIKRTWDNARFQATKQNLCTILSGIKGTGKTITAKQLCNYYSDRYPIFIIDSPFNGRIVDFVQSLDFKCVLFIDEAEKTFSDDRTSLLKICDGAMNMSPKIILMTMNELNIDRNLISRPGRVRYRQEFGNLPESTCIELLKDNLEDISNSDDIMDFLSTLDTITIDIVQCIVNEVNMYGNLKTVKRYMNIDQATIDTYYVITAGLTPQEETVLMDYCNKAGRDGFGITQLFSYGEDFDKYPKEIQELLERKNSTSLPQLTRGRDICVNSGSYSGFGITKFGLGTMVPGLGKIIEDLGENWFRVSIDISTDQQVTDVFSDGEDDDSIEVYEYRKNDHLLEYLHYYNDLQVGDTILCYLKSQSRFSIYKRTSLTV